MIPYRIINDRGLSDSVKKIAIDDTQKTFESLKTEVINSNAIITIDFMNINYTLKWKVSLENAPKELLNKFNRIK